MNFKLAQIPDRSQKPRKDGITMVMDKGMSIREVEDFLSISEPHVDLVKFGFGSAYVTHCLDEKLNVYKEAKIPTYFGGTLFEAFVARGQFEDYIRILDKYQMEYAEVSDGSITLDHAEKCEYIRKLSKHVTVLSEVGSKDADKIIAPYKWIQFFTAELEAGAYKVIAEARESGNVGIYRGTGEVRMGLVDEILTQIDQHKIIWEAPQKAQQVWFIKLIGTNVNLGNIAPNEVLPLETIRIGLRADTFEDFLDA